jgi:hypothetical protein
MQPQCLEGAETQTTVSCHIKTMQTELLKNAPNMAIIDDRMQRSFAARRASVQGKLRADVLQEYPALRKDQQVNIIV